MIQRLVKYYLNIWAFAEDQSGDISANLVILIRPCFLQQENALLYRPLVFMFFLFYFHLSSWTISLNVVFLIMILKK